MAKENLITVNTAVCEDDPIHANIIMSLLEQYQGDRFGVCINAHRFCSGEDLLESIDNGQVYDLLLLDILMSGISGIELAEKLRSDGSAAPIIFLTSTSDYAFDAFRVFAYQYLLKPIKSADLFPVMDKAIASLDRDEERYFVVNTPVQTVRVPRSTIIFVELVDRAMVVYLQNGSTLRSKTIRTAFANAVDPLLEDGRFICAHKSFVLNLDKIERMTANSFIMLDGSVLPIPRYKFSESKKKYLKWLSDRGIGLPVDKSLN